MGSLASTFESFDALVVGTPTYNTDADRMRTATSWDGGKPKTYACFHTHLCTRKSWGGGMTSLGLGGAAKRMRLTTNGNPTPGTLCHASRFFL